jgi:putative oxidoreductase
MDQAVSPWARYARSLLRIVAGFAFILHGFQKFGYLGGLGGHAAMPWTMLWIAGVLELPGGLLIILGLWTRPVAFVLCGEMAVAYFRTHAPRSFWPLLNGGEITVLYCFIFLYLFTAGAGSWSLDHLLRKNKQRE